MSLPLSGWIIRPLATHAAVDHRRPASLERLQPSRTMAAGNRCHQFFALPATADIFEIFMSTSDLEFRQSLLARREKGDVLGEAGSSATRVFFSKAVSNVVFGRISRDSLIRSVQPRVTPPRNVIPRGGYEVVRTRARCYPVIIPLELADKRVAP